MTFDPLREALEQIVAHPADECPCWPEQCGPVMQDIARAALASTETTDEPQVPTVRIIGPWWVWGGIQWEGTVMLSLDDSGCIHDVPQWWQVRRWWRMGRALHRDARRAETSGKPRCGLTYVPADTSPEEGEP